MNGSVPAGYRLERGFLWPERDTECAAVVFETTADLEEAYRWCRSFDVAVQAGGNMGVWPRVMGQRFGSVYTFEPDPVNFRCLAANASAANIFKFNAALGSRRALVELERDPGNAGAHYVKGAGVIPTLMVDDLGLTSCDLIYLDIEGYEFEALCGAYRTIDAHRPVIVVEDKGLSAKYGTPQGHIERVLAEKFGYRVKARPNRDVVLACER